MAFNERLDNEPTRLHSSTFTSPSMHHTNGTPALGHREHNSSRMGATCKTNGFTPSDPRLTPMSTDLSNTTRPAYDLDPRRRPASPPPTNGSARLSPFGPDVASDQAAPDRKQARPAQGETKGYRAVWDPELDDKLGKEDKRKMKPKLKSFGAETYEADPPPDPRLAIVGYTTGHCASKTATSKSKLRVAPYVLKPYPIDSKYSIGPGQPKQVVVTGFDPFTPESHLRTFFSSYGSVAEVRNQTDPNTGSYLGVCLIKYKDSKSLQGPVIPAAQSAKRAETEGNGERMGVNTLKVQRDREGLKCERLVQGILDRARRQSELSKLTMVPSAPSSAVKAFSQTPHTAHSAALDSPSAPRIPPRGPSSSFVPDTVRNITPFTPHAESIPPVDQEPALKNIKRKPYIFISERSLPVSGSTVLQLKRRLHRVRWWDVRVDKTGYYIIFEDSERGEDDALWCFRDYNRTTLLGYVMEMECQRFGDPSYKPSPSPAQAEAMRAEQDEVDRLKQEEAEDLEFEKKQRAEALDPVLGALDLLQNELLNKIMGDIKMRVAMPALHDRLDPALHVAKRRKLDLADTRDSDVPVSSAILGRVATPPSTPKVRGGRQYAHSKPLRPHDPNSQRLQVSSTNAFVDERRRQPRKAAHARPLAFRLQDMFQPQSHDEPDSDDDSRTPITHDNDDVDSRPLSSTSRTSTPFDADMIDTPRQKKLKTVSSEPFWDPEEECEVFEPFHKQLLGELLHKRPETMAIRELELVVGTLPRSSKTQKKARDELFYRQRASYDDGMFKVKAETDPKTETELSTAVPSTDVAVSLTSVEPVAKPKTKKKAKTKKELARERALKAELEADAKDDILVDVASPPEAETPSGVATEEDEADVDTQQTAVPAIRKAQVEWGVSTDQPRRTVEDEDDIVLDLDGWQHVVKDSEDLRMLSKALGAVQATELHDAKYWAWTQKRIKKLNMGDLDAVNVGVHVPGYYVRNITGSARTEGVQKIRESEKSKYLPHRIRVQKAREEREALADKDQALAAAEASKQTAAAKLASTSSSRSTRVNNRRLVNDINLQKQNGPTSGMETDAFRFNQLKKRKKHVKFDRSAIHGWGLYSEENITANDLIIEYVGEKIRQKVADVREIRYTKQGIGSSYLFRMADDEIIDATKKGGIARFINHSCTPNCTAKIIKVEGTRRIVIYALKDIGKNEELTYDYKFEREYGSNDRIPCLCGSVGCKGFLN